MNHGFARDTKLEAGHKVVDGLWRLASLARPDSTPNYFVNANSPELGTVDFASAPDLLQHFLKLGVQNPIAMGAEMVAVKKHRASVGIVGGTDFAGA